MTVVTPGVPLPGRADSADPAAVVGVLLGTYLFRDSDRMELESLAQRSLVRDLRPGERVYSVGDRATHLVVVAAGYLVETAQTADGDEFVEEVYEPGGVTGEPGLFAPERDRVVTMTATSPATVVLVPRDELIEFLFEHRPAMLRMLGGLAVDARAAVDEMLAIGFHTVRERLAIRLLELAETHGEIDEAGRIAIRVRLSQAALAGLITARRENVNRGLRRFREAGLIAVNGDAVTILDRDALRAVAGPRALSHRRNQRPSP